MKRIILGLMVLIVWCLLVWPFAKTGGYPVNFELLVAGSVVAALAAILFGEDFPSKSNRLLNPVRYFWAISFILVFAWHVLWGNLEVLYLALHPNLPINPGIIKIKTTLSDRSALTWLANSLTLSGYLTVDIIGDNLYLHNINLKKVDGKWEAHQLVLTYETILRRVFE